MLRWRGEFGFSGYGVAARAYVKALDAEGVDVKVDSVNPLPKHDELKHLERKRMLHGKTVYHNLPNVEIHENYYPPPSR